MIQQAQAVSELLLHTHENLEEYAKSGDILKTQLQAAEEICESKWIHAEAGALIEWFKDYREHQSFALDGRGRYERDWIIHNEDLLKTLKAWMTKEAKRDALEVDTGVTYINNVLLPGAARKHLGGAPSKAEILVETQQMCSSNGLQYPICRSTVHAWMVKAGMVTGDFQQNYMTDTHNKPAVVKFRDEIYTPNKGWYKGGMTPEQIDQALESCEDFMNEVLMLASASLLISC